MRKLFLMLFAAAVLVIPAAPAAAQLPSADPKAFPEPEWVAYLQQQMALLVPGNPALASLVVAVTSDPVPPLITWDANGKWHLKVSRKYLAYLVDPDECRALLAHEIAHPELDLDNQAATTVKVRLKVSRYSGSQFEGSSHVRPAPTDIEPEFFQETDFAMLENQERLADLFGFLLMRQRGFDPCASVRLFSRIAKAEKTAKAARRGDPAAQVDLRRLEALKALCR